MADVRVRITDCLLVLPLRRSINSIVAVSRHLPQKTHSFIKEKQMLIDRRDFVKAAAFGSVALSAAAVTGISSATDPIARNGKPKFKFSLAAYSYRALLSGDKPELTMNDFVNECARYQLDGTELTSYYFPKNPTEKYLRNLKTQAFRLGLSVSGTAVGNDFGFAEGKERQDQIVALKRWIDAAEILGAPVIRIFAGHKKEGTTEAQSHSLMVSAIEECCEYAGQHGIYLALENHGGPTATAEGLLKFVRDVQSPWFGVNMDTGNFHSDKIYEELEQIAPYALNVQVKVVTTEPDKESKPTDYVRLARILKDASYRGFIVLEFEEKGDPREECQKHLDDIRAAFQA
jgi:sugar phosphate isomerase/epimerase